MSAGGLRVLSAGAAKAVVQSLSQSFRDDTGVTVTATFDAAGSIRAQFAADLRTDIVILPEAMVDALAADHVVDAASIAPLGRVPTGVAVRRGAAAPAIGDAAALRTAFLAASALYCPDIERSTAGLHFIKMVAAMGIETQVRAKVRAYANGATAMGAMAKPDAPSGALGCTQVTEILYTDGVALVGPLPPPYGLATTYTVAVSAHAANADVARPFAALLTSPDTHALREAGGFARI
ncbi:MAG TPA: substrate-binding domain-containing protein [Casimicrobiaceae bacterium]|nr:substrate-binding domain-containing protein [Casimicrobiaceae bacterium]